MKRRWIVHARCYFCKPDGPGSYHYHWYWPRFWYRHGIGVGFVFGPVEVIRSFKKRVAR